MPSCRARACRERGGFPARGLRLADRRDGTRPGRMPTLDPTERTGLSEAFERAPAAGGRRAAAGSASACPPTVGGGGRPPSFAAAFGYEAAYHDAPLVDTAIVLAGAPRRRVRDGPSNARTCSPACSPAMSRCASPTPNPTPATTSPALTTTAPPQRDGSSPAPGPQGSHHRCRQGRCLPDRRPHRSRAFPRGAGSSMFLVDMTLPGVSVRAAADDGRLRPVGGLFDQVRLPAGGAARGADAGWRQLAFAVEQERTGMFTLGWCQRLFDDLLRLAGGPARPAARSTIR